jgi:hypothetical protein
MRVRAGTILLWRPTPKLFSLKKPRPEAGRVGGEVGRIYNLATRKLALYHCA